MKRFTPGAVIVGGSAAGLAAADGLREGGYDGVITVLDEHLYPGFDRPMLSKALLASETPVAPVSLRTRDRLAENRIDVLSGHRAAGLDVDRRLVVTNWGEAIPWRHLVVATGVSARRVFTVSGDPLPSLRGLADLENARGLAASGRPVTLIGSGFIGLEVAAALRSRGVHVTVIDSVQLPMSRLVGADVATWLQGVHLDRGVQLKLGAGVESVHDVPEGYRIRTTDGSEHTADAVLAGVGGEPNTEWLIGSGVELSEGVLTDAAGQTNIPGVWAAGDVACSAHHATGLQRRFEHWTHAIEQGRQVGLNIARNESVPYSGVPYVWTEQYDVTLHMLGERHDDDIDTVVEGSLDSGEFVVTHGRAGELHAATICGRVHALRTYRKLLRAVASLS